MSDQEAIVKVLADNGQLPTYKLYAMSTLTQGKLNKALDELVKQGRVVLNEVPTGRYWSLIE